MDFAVIVILADVSVSLCPRQTELVVAYSCLLTVHLHQTCWVTTIFL